MTTMKLMHSGKRFRELVKEGSGHEPTGPHIRLMEATGVINPTKNTCGWRFFSDRDVVRAVRWMKAHWRPPGRPRAAVTEPVVAQS